MAVAEPPERQAAAQAEMALLAMALNAAKAAAVAAPISAAPLATEAMAAHPEGVAAVAAAAQLGALAAMGPPVALSFMRGKVSHDPRHNNTQNSASTCG